MAIDTRKQNILARLYYDENLPGSFSGKKSFWELVKSRKLNTECGISFKDVESFLRSQKTYAFFKPARKTFPTNACKIPGPGIYTACDIWDLSRYSDVNDGLSYCLVGLDMFSKLGFCIPMYDKSQKSVITAIESVLSSGFHFKCMFTDRDTAFLGKTTQAFFKAKNIHHFVSHNKFHSFPAERLIQTLTSKLFRILFHKKTQKWVEFLPSVIRSYNRSKHSSLMNGKLSPSEVTLENSADIYKMRYHTKNKKKRKPKFKTGDIVLVAIEKVHSDKFRKSYQPTFREEPFKIKRVFSDETNPMYTIQTLDENETIKGRFYEEELQLVKTF